MRVDGLMGCSMEQEFNILKMDRNLMVTSKRINSMAEGFSTRKMKSFMGHGKTIN